MDQCAFIPRVCCHGGSLSPKPNEQIAWRFIRNDKVLWMRRVWLLHYPSITNDVLQINYQAATSSCWEADLVDESEKLPHGHPSMHGPLFSIQHRARLCKKGGTHIHTTTSRGWCVRSADGKEQTCNLSPDMGWKVPLLDISAGRWSVWHSAASTSLCFSAPVQTAPGFISTLASLNRLQLNLHFVFVM